MSIISPNVRHRVRVTTPKEVSLETLPENRERRYAEVMFTGRLPIKIGGEDYGKVRLPTVVRLYDGCISLSELEGRIRSLDGTLATRVKFAQFCEILTALSLPRRNRKGPLYTTEACTGGGAYGLPIGGKKWAVACPLFAANGQSM